MRHTESTTLISIRLSKSSAIRVARLARERKQTVSAVIREAIEALDGPSIWDQVKPFLSRRGSGKGDLSTRKEHLVGFGE